MFWNILSHRTFEWQSSSPNHQDPSFKKQLTIRNKKRNKTKQRNNIPSSHSEFLKPIWCFGNHQALRTKGTKLLDYVDYGKETYGEDFI